MWMTRNGRMAWRLQQRPGRTVSIGIPMCIGALIMGAGPAVLVSTAGRMTALITAAVCLVTARLTVPVPTLGVAATVCTSLGAGVQIRLSNGTLQQGLIPLVALSVGLVGGLGLGSFVCRPRSRMRRLGVALAGGAIVVRASSLIVGDPASGAVNLAGRSLHLGELARVVFVAAVACLLADSSSITSAWWRGAIDLKGVLRWAAVVVLPAGAILLLMVVLHDTGPAVILAVVISAMTYRSLGPRLAMAPLVAATLGGVLVARSSHELSNRWWDMLDPTGAGGAQLGRALRAMGLRGLTGAGSGSSDLAETIPAANSDYVPAVVGADHGLVVLLAVLALLGCLSLGLLLRGSCLSGVRGALVTGAAALLFVPTMWTGLGNLGLLPFSGIDVPFLAANGTSTAAAGFALGLAVAALRQGRDLDQSPAPARHLQKVVAAGLVVTLVAGVVQAVRLTLTQGGGRLPGETELRSRGDLTTADGQIIAKGSRPSGVREYPSPELYRDLGWSVPKVASQGVERVAAGALTCGEHSGTLARIFRLGIQPECSPTTTVTTIDSHVQAAALREATQNGATTVVVLDVVSGGVVAAATDPSTSPGPGLSDKSVRTGRALTGQPLPQSLQTVPFSRMLAPGSTFKIVTATMAELNGLQAPPLGRIYEPQPGTQVKNVTEEACPGTSVTEMLAYSCNTTAAWLATHVDSAKFSRSAAIFGFGTGQALVGPPDPTVGTDPISWKLAGAVTGLSATSSPADYARTGFGQAGVRASVFDMAYATGVVVSRGRIPAPTMVAGICQNGTLLPWRVSNDDARDTRAQVAGVTPSQLESALESTYKGMRAAVEVGTARRVGQLATAHQLAAKTGTAEAALADGTPATLSWITVAVDDRYVITIAVQPTNDQPHPAPEHAALNVAARIVQALDTPPAPPTCS